MMDGKNRTMTRNSCEESLLVVQDSFNKLSRY